MRISDWSSDVCSSDLGLWRVAPVPRALLDRRVEITGPVDPKMVINALNSGANCYMADFEDSTAPTWARMVAGQRALREAVAGTLAYTRDAGEAYARKPFEKEAVLDRPSDVVGKEWGNMGGDQ